MQLSSTFLAIVGLLAVSSSVDGLKHEAKLDAIAANFKTVANPPIGSENYFNIKARNGKYCLFAKHHRVTKRVTLRATRKCSAIETVSENSPHAFFRVPAGDTEAASDFYLATNVDGKPKCLRTWHRMGSPYHGWFGHPFMFDECRPDISYTFRETGSEKKSTHLLELTQMGTGKYRSCLKVSRTGIPHVRRCHPGAKGQELEMVYPTKKDVEEVEDKVSPVKRAE